MPDNIDDRIQFITDHNRIENILFIKTRSLVFYLNLSEDTDLTNAQKIEEIVGDIEEDLL